MDIKQFAEQSAQIIHNYIVTSEVYYSFQRCSNDYNPLHTDIGFAAKKGFKDIVVYGNILNCFVSHFVGMLLPSREVMILFQNISYRKPVFIGDEIEMNACLEKYDEDVALFTYILKFRRKDQTGKTELVANGHVQITILNDKKL